jgi:alkane 1-monooxygenase
LEKGQEVRMNILSFSMVYLVPVTVYFGYWLGGIYTFMTPFLVFVIGPLLDFIIGRYTRNPSEEAEKKLEADNRYKMVTFFCVPIQLAVVFWGAYVVSYGDLSPLEIIGLIFSVGVSSDVLGLSAAHELAHRINVKSELMLSKILYGSVLYIHFGLEHVVGHHKRVGTPEDPATARLGESFYAFLPRTLFGGFNSAWEFEADRMKKQNKPVWSMRNPMVVGLLAQVTVTVLIAVVFGRMGIFYFLAQSFIAIILVENANYVVHYGLLRKEIAPGKYEPVRPWHSWNSSNWLSNHFLFNIQRHSDHHYKPGRRYQLLRHYDEVPQLPTGYAGMIVLAFIPPLWRKIMDSRVLEFQQSQKD